MSSLSSMTLSVMITAGLVFTAGCGASDSKDGTLPFPDRRNSSPSVHFGGGKLRLIKTTYHSDGYTRKTEEMSLDDGSTVLSEFSEKGLLKRIEERFPPVGKDGTSSGPRRRISTFKDDGEIESDLMLRTDGTVLGISTSVESTYQTIIYDRTGTKPTEVSILDRKDGKWELRHLVTYRDDGSVETRTIRAPDLRYERTFLDKRGTAIRKQYWNRSRTAVRSLDYSAGGKNVKQQIDESAQETTVIDYGGGGKIAHMRQRIQDMEVATIFDSRGTARFRQIWMHEKTDSKDEKVQLSRIEEITGAKNGRRSFYYYPDGITIQVVIEKSRKGNEETISTYDRGGLLIRVEKRDGSGSLLRKEEYAGGLRRAPSIPEEYTRYRPFSMPPSSLTGRPRARRLSDAS
ncbi:MAG: hypothetical protein KC777_08670 [Cyanobacteria bacterium HKST-UBA02]|nr:hypothetical protein [Cyanobacteria bacterium HKST-UBA02]